MRVNLDEIRERDAALRAKLREIGPDLVPISVVPDNQLVIDRAALLALVDELLSLTRRLAAEAHAIDYEQERCLDDCPGCDAEELLDVLEGDAK
jgi:hypothetical protein